MLIHKHKSSYTSPIPLAKMRYYEQKYPEVDELVMVQVRQIAEMGAYVKLVRFIVSLEWLIIVDLVIVVLVVVVLL